MVSDMCVVGGCKGVHPSGLRRRYAPWGGAHLLLPLEPYHTAPTSWKARECYSKHEALSGYTRPNRVICRRPPERGVTSDQISLAKPRIPSDDPTTDEA